MNTKKSLLLLGACLISLHTNVQAAHLIKKCENAYKDKRILVVAGAAVTVALYTVIKLIKTKSPSPAVVTEDPLMHIYDIAAMGPRGSGINAHQRQLLERLKVYYGDGKIEGSPYLQEVSVLCKQVEDHLFAIKPDKKDIVIFDIDDTLISWAAYFYKKHFQHAYYCLASNSCACKELDRDAYAVALEPVKKLWHGLIERGFPLAIISNSPKSALRERLCELKKVGYMIPEGTHIYLTPDHKKIKGMTEQEIAVEKLVYRQQLAEKGHRILSNIGDQKTDFIGGHNGRELCLPNYLMRNANK